MTQDEIIEMARQAGFMLVTDSQEGQSDWYECFTEEIEAFAKPVAAKEQKEMIDLVAFYGGNVYDIQTAIRARGET